MNALEIYLLLISMVTMETVRGAKILVVAPEFHSHANTLAVAGGALVEAGHKVHFLAARPYKNLGDRHGMTGLYFHENNNTSPMELTQRLFEARGVRAKMSAIYNVSCAMGDTCHQILGDKELNAQIAEAGYDMALVDSLDVVRCLMVMPYIHGIPFITIGTRHDPWSARVSASPSAEGHYGLHPFSDPYNPTLWERWTSVVLEIVVYNILTPMLMNGDFVTKYAPNRPAISMRELYQNAELHFMDMETCCLDTPRVAAPHYIYLGVISTGPANVLSGEVEKFVDSAKDGLIVVSFGSAVEKLPMSRMEAMLEAFQQLPQKVIMRYNGPLSRELPSNVKLLKWLPQNDLLGHSKTRLFITHGGANGQTEALYHGIPFVSIPLMPEQAYNAERGVVRGFGAILDFHTFTADELLTAVRQVMHDSNFTERIKNCSVKYKAMPPSRNTLTFWVDHVIKHGGDHLKPTYLKMPLWRWFNLDILFICFILIHLNVHIARFLFKGIRYMVRTFCQG